MILPTLYKKTSTGAIQQWSISASSSLVLETYYAGVITTTHGQVDGKLQTTEDIISKGKNHGKKNETDAVQQAELEAQSKWEKQKKKGYVESIQAAQAGELDKLIEGGIVPMLAHSYADHAHKIKYPAYVQPKLDGCLHGKTKIDTDIGVLTIAEIVNKKIKCNVLSYNEISGITEYKPILNWFDNGMADYKKWMCVKLSRSHIVKCTENHKLYTDNGWKRADELDPLKDKLLGDRGSDRQFSLILGTLLGDSCPILEKRCGNSLSYRIAFTHANFELCKFKSEIINITGNFYNCKSGYGSDMLRFVSSALTNTNFPIDKIIFLGNNENKGKRKLIQCEFLIEFLCDEGLSLWIADDGSLAFNNGNKLTPLLSLHTQGFSEDQINEFVQFFKRKYGCVPHVNKDKKVVNGSGNFLTFSTKDTLYILNRLRNFHVKGVEYKYYFPTEGYIKPAKNEYAFYNFRVCGSRRNIPQSKYDIEVEGNHNYFANKVLVHNCRAVAILDQGKCTLWTRTRKPITGVPHIQRAIEKALPNVDITLDGELYQHEFKANFEKIVSFVRQETPAEGHEVVQYHIYDIPGETTFANRAAKLRHLPTGKFTDSNGDRCCLRVDTVLVEDEAEAMTYFQKWRKEGYEGAMIRNAEGLYVNKRSYDLLKMKEFDDAEFKIVGAEEGRGKLQGHVGAFVCVDASGRQFLAKMSGDTERLGEYFRNPALYMGKMLTVKYQGLTGANSVPRFPVGIAIRDYE